VWYKTTNIPRHPGQTIIVWDVFTNPLCYYPLRGKKVLYSEYFWFKKSRWKELVFWIVWWLFLHWKKIIVPTKLAYHSFSRISSHCLYFPILYHGTVLENPHPLWENIRFVFVGRLSNTYKNIFFLIDAIIILHTLNPRISLTLVWELYEDDLFVRYQQAFDEWILHYEWKVSREEALTIMEKSDIFVLCSNSDPIWAVILESMAHACAILVSDTCGASWYIHDGENGFVFETNNIDDFVHKARILTEDLKLLETMKIESLQIIRNYYRCENKELLDRRYKQFISFLNNSWNND
jgi:glycosyltransferase involved in cell wall biosynthesis